MNQYDDPLFFEEYSRMSRSQLGLSGAGEWHQLEPMFPDLAGKRVLDLGCGYGWHCKYAAEKGATAVLVLHYLEDLQQVYRLVYSTLKPGGSFLFNIEHPTYTAGIGQQFSPDGSWPVTDYYYPGERVADFLGYPVKKYHHTLTQILGGLLACGFVLCQVEEAMPPEAWRDQMPEEMRRPMMLLVRAEKPGDK